ncbi:MAG: hypothetical protein ACRDWT_00585 [Jatrophihabitantaceae bacterium]
MDTPVEFADAVESVDLDRGVRVIVVAGHGAGFCVAYDLAIFRR